ncbi:MAG TPA: hypothetical protein VEM58_09425 [Streptosporangiaceae bacterium]|nr:hypothetical protein [Streptosporangiaceae bacterium]
MNQFWIVIGAAIATAAVAAPVAAIVLVSIASRREESAHSLYGRAPGPVTAAARRLLAFRSDQVAALPQKRPAARSSRPAAPGRRQIRPGAEPKPAWLIAGAHPAGIAPGPVAAPDLEVRFAHARRSVPDASQYPARHQSQPRSVRADQRQGAGV